MMSSYKHHPSFPNYENIYFQVYVNAINGKTIPTILSFFVGYINPKDIAGTLSNLNLPFFILGIVIIAAPNDISANKFKTANANNKKTGLYILSPYNMIRSMINTSIGIPNTNVIKNNFFILILFL